MTAILRVQGLTKRFDGLVANDGIDLEVSRGGIHAVIGPNGAGKTTFMSQIAGEQLPDSGRIEFDGVEITNLRMPKRVGMGLGRCYQVSRVFTDMPALDNVAIGVLSRAGRHFRWWGNARKDKDIVSPAQALLQVVGLEDRGHVDAGNLSHGERRQLEIAMALATEPKLLLLDEPMAGLGAQESKRLVRLISSLCPEKAILLIEHDMDVVFELAQTITVLVNGRVIACGTPDQIRTDERVKDAYLASEHGGDGHA